MGAGRKENVAFLVTFKAQEYTMNAALHLFARGALGCTLFSSDRWAAKHSKVIYPRLCPNN
jgi:hypothetical protein